jgi:hypothetical protein
MAARLFLTLLLGWMGLVVTAVLTARCGDEQCAADRAMPNSASCGSPQTKITASRTPRIRLNLVKMFARRISGTERLVRSPPALVSPRERRSAT